MRLLLLLIVLLASLPAQAAGPIRVLFLGQEEKNIHDSGASAALLMKELGRDAIYFDYFTQPDCLNPETLAHYDAVLLYSNQKVLKPEQFDALNAFIESGRGFLPIHSASACFVNEPRFAALVGARFKQHGAGVFKVTIVDQTHPIMAGVKEYETWDETYVHEQHNEQGRKLLAEREREPWTWVREQGKGRIFYTASGHDQRTWGDRDFQRMVRNAIVWAVGDRARGEWEKFLAQREPEKRRSDANVANYEKRAEPLTLQEPFSVKGSVERTQVPADMKLELFAAEPDISKPIFMAWDERGRLWLAETTDYPHDVKPSGEGNDRIKICEDTDGDGRADKFTIFADKLNIPTSFVFANGGVIITQPPRMLFLKDSNGDDKADTRDVIMEGWGISDTHAQANNLHYGLDNWLYGCVGYSGFKGTVGGQRKEFTMGTYRFKPDGSQLEFLHQFSNNSWGHSANAAGDQFGGTANGAPLFYGGIPASVGPAGMRIMSAKKINEEDKAHPITPNVRQVDVFGGYTSAAGSAFIYSGNLPERLQGMALVCEPTLKIVALMDVRRKGAGYTAKDGFNLVASSDEWMSPVFAEVGPDGAVWFADWQNFIIQHNPTPSVNRGGYDAKTGVGGAHENPLRDHQRGRIYRVVWNKAKAPALKTLQGATTEQLVTALSNDNPFWRTTAQRILVEGKKADAVAGLQQILTADNGSIAAVHALWTLQGLGSLDTETHKKALASKDPALRRNAVRALGSDPNSWVQLSASNTLADPDPTTRLAAMVKLAEFQANPEGTQIVAKLRADASVNSDEWLREGLRILARKHGGAALGIEGPNLLPNPGFETTSGDIPDGWKLRHYNGEAKWETSDRNPHSGQKAVRVSSRSGADTSLYADVPVKPNTEYKLSAWVRTRNVNGALGALLNVHGSQIRTDVASGSGDWTLVETVFNSEDRQVLSVNVLFGGFGQSRGDATFDDLKLCQMLPGDAAETTMKGDIERGELIVFKHTAAACILCHTVKGQGSTVGPALDGIASRKSPKYIEESLLEPNKVLAEGFQQLGASPMPPLGLILKSQEIEDVKAYLQTLK